MTGTIRGVRFAGRAAFLFLVSFGASAAVAADAIEKALPATTFFFVKLDDVKNLKTAFTASQTGQLWADPAMKPLRDKIAGAFEDPNAKIKEALGVTLDELLSLPEGHGSIALVSKDDPKIPLAALIVLDAGDNSTKMAEVMDRADKLAEGAGAKVATEESTGVTFHVIRSNENGDDAPPVIWTQAGSVFYVSTDIETLKDVLANLKGRENSLAASENYTQILKKVGADEQFLWYADVNQVITLSSQVAAGQGGNGDQIAAQVQLSGINGLKAIGGTISFNEGDFDFVSKTFFYAPAPLQGVLKLFSMPATDLKPEPWVPATVSSYSSFSWEIDKFWPALNELVDQFAPGVLEQVEKQLSGPDGGGLDIKKDIFGPFGKRVTTIGDYKKPITETSQRILVAVALSNPTAAQNTINKVIALANADPKKREFQGVTIYDIELPPEVEVAGAGLSGSISIAIAKDHLFVSTEPTLLEQVLRGGGQSLAESAEFQTALKHFPSNVSMFTFERPEDQVQVMYATLNNDQFKTALSQLREQNPNAPDLEEFFDPKLLPDAKDIQKYFSPSGGYAVTSEEGLIYTTFTLKNAK
jgi:hypothetical protein